MLSLLTFRRWRTLGGNSSASWRADQLAWSSESTTQRASCGSLRAPKLLLLLVLLFSLSLSPYHHYHNYYDYYTISYISLSSIFKATREVELRLGDLGGHRGRRSAKALRWRSPGTEQEVLVGHLFFLNYIIYCYYYNNSYCSYHYCYYHYYYYYHHYYYYYYYYYYCCHVISTVWFERQGSFVRDVASALPAGGVPWHGKVQRFQCPSSWRGTCSSVNSTRRVRDLLPLTNLL